MNRPIFEAIRIRELLQHHDSPRLVFFNGLRPMTKHAGLYDEMMADEPERVYGIFDRHVSIEQLEEEFSDDE